MGYRAANTMDGIPDWFLRFWAVDCFNRRELSKSLGHPENESGGVIRVKTKRVKSSMASMMMPSTVRCFKCATIGFEFRPGSARSKIYKSKSRPGPPKWEGE
jgi:hypothetical protein